MDHPQPENCEAWPGGAIDRLIYRILEQAIKDARVYARRGVCEANPPLRWLWDVGQAWAETLGGDALRRSIINACEDIEILAYAHKG